MPEFTDQLGTHFSSNVASLGVDILKSFNHLAPTLWNDGPLEVREAEHMNTLKNSLDSHWRDHPSRLY